VFVRPRFEIYRAISLEVRAIFAEYTPLIEPLALDEAYLDVTENLKGIASASRIAEDIRARIREVTGLTASAGVSYNKFLAKLASDHNKPDGLFVIPPGAGAAFVATLPIGRFHGVGPVTAARMERLGIKTGADLRGRPLEFLRAHFGKAADYYYGAARGIDHRAVRADRVRKSVGTETTFGEDLLAEAALVAGLDPLIASLWDHCARASIAGRTVTVKAKYADFRQVTRSRTLPHPVADGAELRTVALELLATLVPLRMGVRLLGVSLHNLGAGAEAEEPELPLL
jgi:DNA polymerase-4